MEKNLLKTPFSTGLIGLGVMGSHLARNFASKKIPMIVFNRTSSVTERFIRDYGNEYLQSVSLFNEFIDKLQKPRIILLMVEAGPVVDTILDSLLPFLDRGDMVIDLGNSYYRDTEDRIYKCLEKGVFFGGCGISGGEKGALEGPSLMLGGALELRSTLKPVFDQIAAKDFTGGPCVAYCGPGGAGHYVKMVHNGIEYGLMQCMAEIHELLYSAGHTHEHIGDIFSDWQKGLLSGFLTERMVKVLKKKDTDGSSLIDKILDKAQQKGTGTWTVKDALDRGVPVPTIAEAVMGRALSSFWEERQEISKYYRNSSITAELNEPPQVRKAEEVLNFFKSRGGIDVLEKALIASFISVFIQGFELIKTASKEEDWGLDLKEVMRVWQGGCIIRSELLRLFGKSFEDGTIVTKEKQNLLLSPVVKESLKQYFPALQKVVPVAIKAGLPFSGCSSALAYIQAFTQARGNAHIIQALRDAFGSHTYQRLDQPGDFHTEWE